jgi:hypothetical protein
MAKSSSLRSAALTFALIGCGGGTFVPQPINLSVSVNNATITVPPNGTAVNVQVAGLPAGVSYNYQESESNPSGLLTLIANSVTVPGTYMPKITVGTLDQTASTVFTLVISAPPKPTIVRSESRLRGHFSGTG